MNVPDFQEIGHCGGQFIVSTKTENGQRAVSFEIRHSRPVPASFFGVYTLPQGIPVGTIQLGGIGQPWNPAPLANCFPVFVASDSHSFFGHECPRCREYWRSQGAPSRWRITCPYCGLKSDCHSFLTKGQRSYVDACCEKFDEALNSVTDGEFVVDMDEVADAVGKVSEKPKFYYAETSQQNRYDCEACRDKNDILGEYGYCSCCGTYNGFQMFKRKVAVIRERIEKEGHYEDKVRDTVSAFDGLAGSYMKRLLRRIPMMPARKDKWERQLFHKLETCIEGLKSDFGIDIAKAFNTDELAFAFLMFYRRHVYEHHSGEATEKYLQESGDTSVKLKQKLHETKVSAFKITECVIKLASNLHKDFHEIFPPEETPIKLEQERQARLRAQKS